jgi:hypothetical protein
MSLYAFEFRGPVWFVAHTNIISAGPPFLLVAMSLGMSYMLHNTILVSMNIMN